MPETWKWTFPIVGAFIALYVIIGVSFAHAHEWYDFSCCSEKDCRQTVLKEVERRENGWFIAVTNELIPFDDDRVRRSLDPLIHVCLMGNWSAGKKLGEKVRCLYIPEMGG